MVTQLNFKGTFFYIRGKNAVADRSRCNTGYGGMQMKKIRKEMVYILLISLIIMSAGLLFNDNVWFDETYTLALIRHDVSEITDILRSDMHPPLYFAGLKLFCSVFGYHIIVTKLFSVIGFVLLLLLGILYIRKDYGEQICIFYFLIIGAVPFSFYFSVQQRCYSWSMFFVTWCFLEGMRLVRHRRWTNAVLFAVAALGAAYNHIYALIAVAGTVLCLNGWIWFRQRGLWRKIVVADFIMILGYLGWLRILLLQTKKAAETFWQVSLEKDSLVVLAFTVVLFTFILFCGTCRFPVICGMLTILFVHVAGFGISLLVRPLYVARYASPLLGVFAVTAAVAIAPCKERLRSRVSGYLMIVLIAGYIVGAGFEYNGSLRNFRQDFDQEVSREGVFLYNDSSFGIMSYYYPENRHICTYWQPWFAAFACVEYGTGDDLITLIQTDAPVWYVANEKTEIPAWVQKWNGKKEFSFRSDFNEFGVWRLQ